MTEEQFSNLTNGDIFISDKSFFVCCKSGQLNGMSIILVKDYSDTKFPEKWVAKDFVLMCELIDKKEHEELFI